jgi:ubiquinol oxidase
MTFTTLTRDAVRPEIPAGPPKLTPPQLRTAQAETLDAPRLRYSLLARALFTSMDLAYGRTRTIVKFTMLEFIARVPYQAWERMGYLALARYRGQSALARRVFERIVESRADQDNEQWHLLILQDLVQRRGLRQSFLLHRLAPWLVAFLFYHVSWLLFVIRPDWSYRLNADFEDHAEHEYMAYVAEHPELETQPDPGTLRRSTASTGAWPTFSARSATTSVPTSKAASPTRAPPASPPNPSPSHPSAVAF